MLVPYDLTTYVFNILSLKRKDNDLDLTLLRKQDDQI